MLKDICTPTIHGSIIHKIQKVGVTQESIKDDWVNKMEHACNRILFRFNEKGGFPGGSGVKNLPAMQETREMQLQPLSWEDPLEEEMATHSRTLAWRIPWTEEPGGLQSMGSHRVRYNSATRHACPRGRPYRVFRHQT